MPWSKRNKLVRIKEKRIKCVEVTFWKSDSANRKIRNEFLTKQVSSQVSSLVAFDTIDLLNIFCYPLLASLALLNSGYIPTVPFC